jgi:hypothetical protein
MEGGDGQTEGSRAYVGGEVERCRVRRLVALDLETPPVLRHLNVEAELCHHADGQVDIRTLI